MTEKHEVQLNVWIPEDLRNHVAQRAKDEKRGQKAIIADLIREDIARRNGELVTQNALVVVQEIIAAEIRQAHAQLHRDLREDREQEAETFFERLKKQFDRLAGLTVMAVRNGGITRSLTYTSLSKAYGSEFAKQVYDHAREKAHQDYCPKRLRPFIP